MYDNESEMSFNLDESENEKNFDCQDALLKTFETFYLMESESMIKALEESREELKGSIVDFSEEQEKYKEELVKASEGKYSTNRRKENLIPICDYIKMKKNIYNIESNKSKALVNVDGTPQHPTDREAVESYYRKKQRLKTAEKVRKNIASDVKQVTSELYNQVADTEEFLEQEKMRQEEMLRMRLEQKGVIDPNLRASAIMYNYREAHSAIDKERQEQQEKIEKKLAESRKKILTKPKSEAKAITDIDI